MVGPIFQGSARVRGCSHWKPVNMPYSLFATTVCSATDSSNVAKTKERGRSIGCIAAKSCSVKIKKKIKKKTAKNEIIVNNPPFYWTPDRACPLGLFGLLLEHKLTK
jgi:hypothetical protein